MSRSLASETVDPANDRFVLAFPENAPFYTSAQRGRLALKRCGNCTKFHWYPRLVCPFCGSDRTVWEEVEGGGVIYSYSIIRKPNAPYILAYVRLTEGPVLMSTVLDCDVETVAIGMPVSVRFVSAPEGRLVPAFMRKG